MASRVADLRDRNPLPEGTVVVGAGLAVTGAASYGYLVISAPVLGPAQSGSLSVLWALVFMIGGIFLPFEQEVSPLSVAGSLGSAPGPSPVEHWCWAPAWSASSSS